MHIYICTVRPHQGSRKVHCSSQLPPVFGLVLRWVDGQVLVLPILVFSTLICMHAPALTCLIQGFHHVLHFTPTFHSFTHFHVEYSTGGGLFLSYRGKTPASAYIQDAMYVDEIHIYLHSHSLLHNHLISVDHTMHDNSLNFGVFPHWCRDMCVLWDLMSNSTAANLFMPWSWKGTWVSQCVSWKGTSFLMALTQSLKNSLTPYFLCKIC